MNRHFQQFVTIGNAEARDTRLSFRARGLHHYLLSLPPGWHTTTELIAADSREGRGAIRTALNELITYRYVTRTTFQDERGRWSTVMTVHGVPVPEGAEDDDEWASEEAPPKTGKENVVKKTGKENVSLSGNGRIIAGCRTSSATPATTSTAAAP